MSVSHLLVVCHLFLLNEAGAIIRGEFHAGYRSDSRASFTIKRVHGTDLECSVKKQEDASYFWDFVDVVDWRHTC
jgi:hypothetical protein